MGNLVDAQANDLGRLLTADWGVEIQIVGGAFIQVQVLEQTQARETGGTTTPRQIRKFRTDQDFPEGTEFMYQGTRLRIAARDGNEGLFEYTLDKAPAP